MWRTQVINSNLSNANLYLGNLIKVSFTDSNLDSVDLSYGYALNGYFNNVSFRGTNFHSTDLTGCEFINCTLPTEWFNTREGEQKLAEEVVNHLSCEVDLDAAGYGQSDINLAAICASICPYDMYPVRMTSFRMPTLAKYLSIKDDIDLVIAAIIRIATGEESVFAN